jgi:hypothetical protein
MILATKSGWLIIVELIKKTAKTATVRAVDDLKVRRISNSSKEEKLFDSVAEAVDWIGSAK